MSFDTPRGHLVTEGHFLPWKEAPHGELVSPLRRHCSPEALFFRIRRHRRRSLHHKPHVVPAGVDPDPWALVGAGDFYINDAVIGSKVKITAIQCRSRGR